MKIAMIGTGYVGLVTGTCFAEKGHQVTCVDIDREKVDLLKRGESPIYEPGLAPMIKRNIHEGRIEFTLDLGRALQDVDLCFLAVPTNCDVNGVADLSHIVAASESIGRVMTKPIQIVVKSTVPVGTTEQMKLIIEDELQKRDSKIHFQIAFNPEFLKEGCAVDDCMHPERIILGTDDDTLLRELYSPLCKQIITMDIPSAEMTKYAANCMLATRISLMNEFASICESVGADIQNVREGIGSDSRIGYQFLDAGLGFGGSCFPKDLSALRAFANEVGSKTDILDSVSTVNERQKGILFEKIKRRFPNLEGKTIAVWGLAFKPGTDDIREASSIPLIQSLLDAGAIVKAFDPVAMNNMMKTFPSVQYCETEYDALIAADAIALVTEWKQFASVDLERASALMNQKVLFDGRNFLSRQDLEANEFEYFGIGIPRNKLTTGRDRAKAKLTPS